MKIHVHDEQFDGWLHAACGACNIKPPSTRVVSDVEFQELPHAERCRKCAKQVWPYGGEPYN